VKKKEEFSFTFITISSHEAVKITVKNDKSHIKKGQKMFILNNAIKSITRSKGRNILIGFIIFAIAIASCISLSIKNAAQEIVKGYQESVEITASIGVDRTALREIAQSQGTDMRSLMGRFEAPGLEEILQYGDSLYLEDFSYTLSGYLNSDSIVPLTNEEDTQETANLPGGMGGNNPGGSLLQGGQFTRGDFLVIGYSSHRAMRGFIDGSLRIISGEMFPLDTSEPLCVITDELAAENQLEIKDTLSFTNPANEEEQIEFIITGIYTDDGAGDPSAMNWFSNSANQILTSHTALQKITSDTENFQTQLSSVFYLKNTESIDDFETQLREKGLSSIYMLTTNQEQSDETLRPLTNLDRFATIFLLMVLLIGGTILFVLNMINVRERKYEIGVLRAIGMKKNKLVIQFMAELLIVAFVAIILGSVMGAVASVPTANAMLQNEIESLQTSQTRITENFGSGQGMPQIGRNRDFMGGIFNPGQNVNYISQIDAVINMKVLLQLILIGIFLTAVSSIISVVAISRYEPLKILSERS
jgi:putative ABC transport system permease protein